MSPGAHLSNPRDRLTDGKRAALGGEDLQNAFLV